ncbi:transcriptional regulator [alpha proteobacterium HIMB114]|nr:transcriptional regulator [alpha proteobacterium HIMB114]
MNWKKLETFKKISTFKSFNYASKVLKKSQSSFSRDIMSLEKDLGFKLFIRHMKNGIQLTEKGNALLKVVNEFDTNLSLFKN